MTAMRLEEKFPWWRPLPYAAAMECERCGFTRALDALVGIGTSHNCRAAPAATDKPKDWVELAIGQASDELLLAACERRGMLSVGEVPYGSPLSLSRENDKLRAELSKRIKLEEYADDQLRAECERRGLGDSPDLSDAALRRECERRGIGTSATHRTLKASFDAMTTERDEWKRRAEAAEEHLNDPKRVIRVVAADGVDLVPLGSLHDCGRLELLVTRRDGKRLPMRDMLLSGAESGPGIAAKPAPRHDNSVSHLLEDLLCEDAR